MKVKKVLLHSIFEFSQYKKSAADCAAAERGILCKLTLLFFVLRQYNYLTMVYSISNWGRYSPFEKSLALNFTVSP